MKSALKGVLAVLASSVIFGLIPLWAGMFYSGGGNSVSVVTLRMLLPVPLLLVYLLVKKIPLGITPKQLGQIALVTLAGYGGTAMLLLTSYQLIPGGLATSIHFTYPAFVVLLGMLLYREKPTRLNLVCVALCIGGTLLFYDGGQGRLLGVLLALASGLTYAFYIVYLAHSGLSSLPVYKLIFYMHLLAGGLLLVLTLATGTLTLAVTPRAWLGAVTIAFMVSCVGVMLFQRGLHVVGPQKSAILSTFEPLTSLAVGVLLLGEAISLRHLAGCALILTGVVLAARPAGQREASAE